MTHLTTQTIAQWIDGTLSTGEHAAAAAHLDTCDACRAELAMHHAITGAVARGPMAEPSFHFTSAVMAQIIPSSLPARRWFHRFNLPAIIMATGSVAMIFITLVAHPAGGAHSTFATREHSIVGWWSTLMQFVQSWGGSILGHYGAELVAVGAAVMLLTVFDRLLARRFSMNGR